MQAQQMWVEGYKAPIHRSLWLRILTWGAPRMWSGLWVLLCLMATAWAFAVFEARVYLVPMILWPLGQALLKTLDAVGSAMGSGGEGETTLSRLL